MVNDKVRLGMTFLKIIIILILDGNSETVAHTRKRKSLFGEENMICEYSRSNPMPQTDQITDIVPFHAYLFLTYNLIQEP